LVVNRLFYARAAGGIDDLGIFGMLDQGVYIIKGVNRLGPDGAPVCAPVELALASPIFQGEHHVLVGGTDQDPVDGMAGGIRVGLFLPRAA
jgi:hypothetical protein